jgi:UPF0176 protein
VPKSIKQYIGKGTHFYSSSVSAVLIEENEIKIEIRSLLKAQLETGINLEEMLVNEVIVEKAVAGDICTFKLPFRIRLSDRLYKSKACFIIKF